MNLRAGAGVRAVAWVLTAAISAVLGAGLAACGKGEDEKRREEAAEQIRLAEKYVREKVREPASAQFRNQFIGKQGAPCGEVNAKDAFGAYIGYQRYISVARDLTLLAQDVAPAEFEASWLQLCQR